MSRRGIALYVAAVVLVLGLAFVVAFPATIVGVERDALADSVEDELGASVGDSLLFQCRRDAGPDWLCGAYEVEVDWRSCWNGEAYRMIPDRDPRTISGCISTGDAFFAGPGPDPS